MDLLTREHARDERVRERIPQMYVGAALARLGPSMPRALAIVMLLAFCTLPACSPSRPDTRPTAQCCVCRCNNDLGCLIVHIDDKTPRSTYRDKVYYFCSEDCKAAFDKSPEPYLKR